MIFTTYTSHVTPIAPVASVAWSPDGTSLASTVGDGRVYVWDATTGTTQYVFPHKAPVGSLAWSPDSKYLATGDYNDDDSVRIWNIATASNVQVFPGTAGNLVYTVACSPDGRYLAAGYDGGQVKIGRLATGEQVLTDLGHSGPVMSVQWSHNGRYIASGGFDKTVQLRMIS